MGEHAACSHTSVSVLGIEGSTCAMDALSACATITNGTVNILHPLEMVRQIRLISQNPTVATEVEVLYFLHPCVTIERPSESKRTPVVKDVVGNALKQTDVSLSFVVDASKLKNVSALPFQVSRFPTFLELVTYIGVVCVLEWHFNSIAKVWVCMYSKCVDDSDCIIENGLLQQFAMNLPLYYSRQ